MKTSVLVAALCALSTTVSAQDCKVNKPFDIQFWKLQNMVRTKPSAFVPFL